MIRLIGNMYTRSIRGSLAAKYSVQQCTNVVQIDVLNPRAVSAFEAIKYQRHLSEFLFVDQTRFSDKTGSPTSKEL